MNGIDVSSYQGRIDWTIVKDKIDFAIIRCGYGDDEVSQDDTEFINNVNGCINNNIPFGIYLYSYATRLNGSESVGSEIEHMERLLNSISRKPFAIYLDMEDNSIRSLGRDVLTSFALKFCSYFTNLGYKTGVYASESWFNNELDVTILANYGYSLWCAKYSQNKPDISASYDIWQYSSSGIMDGINGYVDLNMMENNILDERDSQVGNNYKVTYQTWDDVKKTWLPNVVNDSDYAGIFTHDVCCVYASSNIGNVYYRVHFKNGRWLPEVKNREDYAGIYGKPIDGFMIRSDSNSLTYRVHLRRQGRWLPWVTGYDTLDSNNGYAGIINNEIDAIQIKEK